MTIIQSTLRRFRFFRAHAGGVVGECAVGALRLARAEALLFAQAGDRVRFVWTYDGDHDKGPRDWGWSDAEVARWEHQDHCCEVLSMYVDGEMVDCLGGIWDADGDYRRVLEAEMLSTYLSSTAVPLFAH